MPPRKNPHRLDLRKQRFIEGHDGAKTIFELYDMKHVTQIDLRDNPRLGDEGVGTFVYFLEDCASRDASPLYGEWGLTELRLRNVGITDDGAEEVMGYARRTSRLKRLHLKVENIESPKTASCIALKLNRSHISEFYLSFGTPIAASTICEFLSLLSAPHLDRLSQYIRATADSQKLTTALIHYLLSPRSRILTELYFPGHTFDPDSIDDIADHLDRSNFTLQYLSFRQGEHMSSRSRGSLQRRAGVDPLPYEDRLTALLERNRGLAFRVQQAALRCLPSARIILNAKRLPASPPPPHPPPTHFRLLDFPSELVRLIVRHTSGDPTALSHAQAARLLKGAKGRGGLARAIQRAQNKETEWPAVEGDPPVKGLAESWLASGGWDAWDCDVKDVTSGPA